MPNCICCYVDLGIAAAKQSPYDSIYADLGDNAIDYVPLGGDSVKQNIHLAGGERICRRLRKDGLAGCNDRAGRLLLTIRAQYTMRTPRSKLGIVFRVRIDC